MMSGMGDIRWRSGRRGRDGPARIPGVTSMGKGNEQSNARLYLVILDDVGSCCDK